MAGRSNDFDGSRFREEIRSVYTMAMVPDPDEQAMFLFAPPAGLATGKPSL